MNWNVLSHTLNVIVSTQTNEILCCCMWEYEQVLFGRTCANLTHRATRGQAEGNSHEEEWAMPEK